VRGKAAPELLRNVDQVRGREQKDPRAYEGLRGCVRIFGRGYTSRRAA
jgi:hypothetical protein